MNKTIIMGVVLLISIMSGDRLSAQGTAITYQGQLKDGTNPANGSYDLSFALYNTPTSGAPLGSVVYVDDKTVANGLFVDDIDFGTAVFDGADRWLEIGVRAGSVSNSVRTGYTTLAPRQKVAPAPYSIMSRNSSALGGKTPADFMASTADNWVNTTGDTMSGPLAISGLNGENMFKATNTGAGYAGAFTASGSANTGLYTYSSGTNAWALEAFAEGSGTSIGGRFDAAGGNNSKGVEGNAANDGAFTNYGGYFTASGSTGMGVYGKGTGANGYGMRGESSGATGIGGYFSASGTNGRAVNAYTSAANAWAVEAFAEGSGTSVGGYFEAAGGNNSKGVEGKAGNDGTFTNYGGYFTAEGGSGEGVYGKSGGVHGIGVHGVANGTNARGGYFSSSGTNGYGLQAHTTAANAWTLDALAEGTGSSVAGHFLTNGATGKAVEGIADNNAGTLNYGGYFRADGVSAQAIFGQVSGASAKALVVGHTNDNYAHLGTSQYAALFNGPVKFQGHIAGNVISEGDFKYSTARTYTHFFAPNAFSKMEPWDAEYYATTDNTAGYLMCSESCDRIVRISTPVNLPDGANITEITTYYYDNLEYDMQLNISLRKRLYDFAGYSEVAQQNIVTTGQSTTVQSKTTQSISGGVVSNSGYSYWLVVQIQYYNQMHTSEKRYFYGVKVVYTLDTVTQ